MGLAAAHRLPATSPAIGLVMFLFFSNRLGCAGSLVLSLAVTVVLVLLLWR